jgi:hypothetical protein
MSSLGPDGTFLDERPTGQPGGAAYAPKRGPTDVSAAPLWMAFRDHYTRARERRQLGGAGQWTPAGAQPASPCP